MKNLLNLIIAIIISSATFAQMPAQLVEEIIAMEQEISEVKYQNEVPAKIVNHKHTDRLYIKPQVVLSEAVLNILDAEENVLIAYQFSHLSELDLSIKRLPAGEYTLNISGKEGSITQQVHR